VSILDTYGDDGYGQWLQYLHDNEHDLLGARALIFDLAAQVDELIRLIILEYLLVPCERAPIFYSLTKSLSSKMLGDVLRKLLKIMPPETEARDLCQRLDAFREVRNQLAHASVIIEAEECQVKLRRIRWDQLEEETITGSELEAWGEKGKRIVRELLGVLTRVRALAPSQA
jgi:hypothetical protein